MASDFLEQLDSLGENGLQEKYEGLIKEMQLVLEGSDFIVQGKLVCSFIQKVVSCLNESNAESMVKALLPAAEKVNNNIFKDLQHWKDASHISTHLQAAVEVLDGISACCQCVEEKNFQQTGLITCMMLPAFQAIKAIYSHCQDSSQLYSSVLESVNSPLTKLFRAATALQSSLHNMADTVADDSASQQQLTLLTSVCDNVAETGQQLTRLDTRAMAEAWKCYLRLLQQLPDQLPPAVQLGQALSFMTGEVASQMTIIRQQGHSTASATGGDKRLARPVKMCTFYLKLVVGLSESYTSAVGGALDSLVRMVLTLIRYSAPDGHVADLDPAVLNQLSSQLTVAWEPLLDCLITHEDFSKTFWSSLSTCEDLGGLCLLRCCLSLVRRACHLAEPERTSWTADGDGERHLVAAVLRLMPLCDRELTCCVQLDCDGYGRPQVSLYQHTLSTVCALIGTLSPAELRATEVHLWRHLCRSGGWAALLAADTLCFVARYGPASLCRSYCQSAAAALSRRRCAPLRRLLCRLVPLLAEEDRAELLRRPAVSADLLHPVCPPGLLEPALGTAEQLVGQLSDGAGHRLTGQQLTTLRDSLYACRSAGAASVPGPQRRLLSVLERLWCVMPARLTGPAGHLLATGLLRATAGLPADSALTDRRLTQALSLCSDWLPECSVLVKLGIIEFLWNIRARQFQSLVGIDSPAHFIPGLYRTLLTDPSRLVRQRALDTFAAFASCTPHAQLISAAVSAPAGLQGTVSRHVQRLAGRPRGPAGLSEALGRAGASSAAPAAPLEVTSGSGGGLRGLPKDGTAGRPVAAPGADPCRPAPGDGPGPALPAREARLLDGIQRRLSDLSRRGGGGGGRLLRLLTDLQARLDAG